MAEIVIADGAAQAQAVLEMAIRVHNAAVEEAARLVDRHAETLDRHSIEYARARTLAGDMRAKLLRAS